MSATAILTSVLGSAAFITAAYTAFMNWRERKVRKLQQEGQVKLTDAQVKEAAAQAASINIAASRADRLESEQWFAKQIEALRKDLDTEQKSRRRLEAWANVHQLWDRRAWLLALESDPQYPAPPQLEDFGD